MVLIPPSGSCLANHSIINFSLSSNTFPEAWRKANVIPVPKCESPNDLNSFRPISLLPTLSKIIEKVVAQQVVHYLNDHNLFSKYQSGYRKNHSTSTALLKVCTDIINAMDDGKIAILTLLDYSKAFDTVNHTLLLAKLQALGFMIPTIQWFRSYLFGRSQRVVQNNNCSGWLNIVHGVPQGSILGPLLFCLMCVDIEKEISFLNYHMYADDTQLYNTSTVDDIDSAIIKHNFDLNKVSTWSQNNYLQLNISKCVTMCIGSKHLLNQLDSKELTPVSINGIPLPKLERCKNLGVIFDSSFKWEPYINSLISKSFFKLKSLYRFKDFLSPRIKLKLCDTLILSSFNYCDSLFSNITIKLQKKIQRIQNACLRFSFSLNRYDHVSPYLTQAGWYNMKHRREMHNLCCIYKILNGDAPSYLLDEIMSIQTIHGYATRNEGLPIPRFRTKLKQNSFFVKSIGSYNALPTSVVNSPSLQSFKINFKKYFALFQTGN